MHFRSEILQFGAGPLDSVDSFVPVLSEFDEFSRFFYENFFSKNFLIKNHMHFAMVSGTEKMFFGTNKSTVIFTAFSKFAPCAPYTPARLILQVGARGSFKQQHA